MDVVLLPSLHPSIYRAKGEGVGPLHMELEGGGQGGGGLPPKPRGRPL